MNVVQLPESKPAPQPSPLLIRVEEAARLLGLGRTKTYELIATGQLRAVRPRTWEEDARLCSGFYEALFRTRTGDPLLTMEVLYQLS